jgi:hypothetical protein
MSHALGEVPGALDAGQGGGREVLTGTLKNFGISQESKSHFGEANGLSEHEETKGFGITRCPNPFVFSCSVVDRRTAKTREVPKSCRNACAKMSAKRSSTRP